MVIMLTVIAVVISLVLVVGVHEAGHAWAAHFFNVKIKKISIGFGRALLSWQSRSGCQWMWSMWPVGGYVQLLNSRIEPVLPDDYPYSFDKKPIWVRCVILLSGAAANLVMAWLALMLILVLGYQQTRPVVEKISMQSIASIAGLTDGDQIIRVAGEPVFSWRGVGMQLIMNLGHNDVEIVVVNEAGEMHPLRLDLMKWHYSGGKESLLSAIGITPDLSAKQDEQVAGLPWLKAFQQAFLQMMGLLYFFLVLLKQLLSGVIPFALLLGPIGLFTAMANSLLQGLTVFLYFIASLSLSVGLINLFPIPGLDGGSILYAVVEKIRNKPVSVATEILLHRLFFIAFCLILVQLLLNDFQRYLH